MKLQPPRSILPRANARQRLGQSGLEVSPICLGCVEYASAVEAGYEAGINFFFVTSDMHWRHYEPLRNGIRNLLARGVDRDELVVAGVTYAPASFVEPALADIRNDFGRLDVSVAGAVFASTAAGQLAAITKLRGVRQAIGASFHDRELVPPVINRGDLEIAFVRYNPIHPGAMREVFPHVHARQALLYGFKSMSGWQQPEALRRMGLDQPDDWHPRPVDQYRFALSRPEIDGILCAPADAKQIAELVDALDERGLSADEEAYLINVEQAAQDGATIE